MDAKEGFIYNCNQGFVTFSAKKIIFLKDANGSYKKKKCGSYTKQPKGLPSGWQKFTEDDYDHLFNELKLGAHEIVCVQTGKNSDITVLDFDIESTYDEMVMRFPQLKEHYTVKTKRGYHVYFTYDARVQTSTNVFENYPGVDVRNDDGFVYAPGSKYKHPDGSMVTYDFVDGDLTKMPGELFHLFQDDEPRAAEQAAKPVSTIKKEISSNNLIEQLCDLISVEYLTDFKSWRKIMWALHKEGVDEEFAQKISEKADNYEDSAFDNMWNKVPEKNKLSAGTIHYYAKLSNPDEYQKITQKSPESFSAVSKIFEENNFKILNGGYYIAINKEGIANMLSKTQMVERFEHMSYIGLNEITNKMVPKPFIKSWITMNKDIKMYDVANVYPPGMETPNNHYNLWEDFAMESVHDYKKEIEGFNFMRQHFRTLCGNDENFDYFEGWISQMITHPYRKSGIMPVFIGRQGTGKTSIAKILEAMIGSNKVIDVSNPDYVLGQFNESLISSYLVHFTELSKSAIGSNDRLKELITDNTVQVNQKGKKIIKINSFHRVIAFTNNEDPLQTSKDDRRNWIIRCNDELAGKTEYFNQLYEFLRDINVVKSLYEFYKNEVKATKFYYMDRPVSEHHEELKQLNRPIIIQWLNDFIAEKIKMFEIDCAEELESVEYQNSDLYKKFCEWREAGGIKYDVSVMQFSCRLTNYKIDGIEKNQRKRSGAVKTFHLDRIMKFLEENY
jgi:hypothetical protein